MEMRETEPLRGRQSDKEILVVGGAVRREPGSGRDRGRDRVRDRRGGETRAEQGEGAQRARQGQSDAGCKVRSCPKTATQRRARGRKGPMSFEVTVPAL